MAAFSFGFERILGGANEMELLQCAIEASSETEELPLLDAIALCCALLAPKDGK